jgi:5-methylcytosine-specific restriction endonuclease McrA
MDWIFVRDGGLCGICLEPVDRDLPALHPQAATLDHAVPLSKGGLHIPENVQLAHRACNSLKSNATAGWRRVVLPAHLTAMAVLPSFVGSP